MLIAIFRLGEYKKHPRAYKCLKMGEAEKFDRLTRSGTFHALSFIHASSFAHKVLSILGKLQEAEDFIQKTVYSLSITKRKMKKLKLLRALAYHRRGKLEQAFDVYLELLKFDWKSQSYLYQCKSLSCTDPPKKCPEILIEVLFIGIWAAYHAAKLLKYEGNY